MLSKQLEELEAQWSAFVLEKSGRSASEEAHAIAPETSAGLSVGRKSAGRPVGSGSYKTLDLPIVEEMREAMLNDSSLSATAAARNLVDKIAGAGTPESKIKRLADRYSEKYGTEVAGSSPE